MSDEIARLRAAAEKALEYLTGGSFEWEATVDTLRAALAASGAPLPGLGQRELAAMALYEDCEGLKWVNARNETRAEWRRIADVALDAGRGAEPPTLTVERLASLLREADYPGGPFGAPADTGEGFTALAEWLLPRLGREGERK